MEVSMTQCKYKPSKEHEGISHIRIIQVYVYFVF